MQISCDPLLFRARKPSWHMSISFQQRLIFSALFHYCWPYHTYSGTANQTRINDMRPPLPWPTVSVLAHTVAVRNAKTKKSGEKRPFNWLFLASQHICSWPTPINQCKCWPNVGRFGVRPLFWTVSPTAGSECGNEGKKAINPHRRSNISVTVILNGCDIEFSWFVVLR